MNDNGRFYCICIRDFIAITSSSIFWNSRMGYCRYDMEFCSGTKTNEDVVEIGRVVDEMLENVMIGFVILDAMVGVNYVASGVASISKLFIFGTYIVGAQALLIALFMFFNFMWRSRRE